MSKKLLFTSPLSVVVGKKKYNLNLNTYRNIHYRVNNFCKIAYKKIMREQLVKVKKKIIPPVKITYTLFTGSSRLCDLGNVCCVVEKYFEDAATEYGILEDDNYKYIDKVQYIFGGIDKENPRCIIEIESEV